MTAGALYVLGVGGPEDASGIGDVGAFVWRFALIVAGDVGDAGEPPVALAFTTMPALMQFTRAVNGREPFAVPTEAFKLDASALAACDSVRPAIDPTPEAFERLRRGRAVVLRAVPELVPS